MNFNEKLIKVLKIKFEILFMFKIFKLFKI